MDFIDELNEAQRKAVINTEGPALVIAGAGSGKTRVLTYRIAQLLKQSIPPYRILALTFTNKASREMRSRINLLIGNEMSANIWMGTFHSIFSKILRFEAEKLGYSSNFTIFDTQDSKNLVKSIIKELKLDNKVYKANVVFGRISMAKNNLITAEKYVQTASIISEDTAKRLPRISDIYTIYQKRCKQNDSMDFDDLLLKTNILFKDFPSILSKYQEKFKYILVDEYQDTNYSQYLIVKKLSATNRNICVVGDDAQSIYSFRGARIENILNFKSDYPESHIYKLERNYRSTKTIVKVANDIIGNNKEQIQKEIWSENEDGDKIKILKCLSDKEEGYKVSNAIFTLARNTQTKLNEIAILYRTNAQSRIMEEALRKNDIPYTIYGGTSFYQRKEIKDILAYFRVIINPNDGEAIKRIINYPKRGIGDTSVGKLQDLANVNNVNIWDILNNDEKLNDFFNSGTVKKLKSFKELIQGFIDISLKRNAYDSANEISINSGIHQEIIADSTPEGISKKENIQEMLNSVQAFSQNAYREGSKGDLSTFMEGVALLTDQDGDKSNDTDKVTMMTIHAAKGLEFSNVFIVGLEEDLFPSAMSINSHTAIEEERRLFYVALTRAKKRLFLSFALSRYRNGQILNTRPSRFVKEINTKYLDGNIFEVSHREAYSSTRNVRHHSLSPSYSRIGESRIKSSHKVESKPTKSTDTQFPILNKDNITPISANDIKIDMIIYHTSFGTGKILTIDGIGSQKKARVVFKDGKIRILLLKFAKLFIEK